MLISAHAASTGHRRSAAAFAQYVSGRRAISAGTVFFVESAAHLDDVRRLAERDDMIIAPAGAAPRPTPRIIGYEGSLVESGDELVLDGGQAFELRDYGDALPVSVVGLTVVRQRSAGGLAAFLRDADAARESGVLLEHLLCRAVLLESGASFACVDPSADSLVRVHVTAEGEYRDGPDGLLLGRVGDVRADLEAVGAGSVGRGRAFARIVDPRMLEADLDDRPWIEGYVASLVPPRRTSQPRCERAASRSTGEGSERCAATT
jgi:hypothetical protein